MPRTDSASRIISAPVADVYSALVDPEALVIWVPPGAMTATIEQFDPRPGGRYRMVLRYPDSAIHQGKTTTDTDVVEAQFVELVPGVRVVYAVHFSSDDPAYAGAMVMRWEIDPVDDGTRVEIRAENVPDVVSATDHAAGLTSSLAKLDEYLAGRHHRRL